MSSNTRSVYLRSSSNSGNLASLNVPADVSKHVCIFLFLASLNNAVKNPICKVASPPYTVKPPFL